MLNILSIFPFDQLYGQFQDIELLKSRPAHMAVFMRYVFTQLLDPNPLVSANKMLFYLVCICLYMCISVCVYIYMYERESEGMDHVFAYNVVVVSNSCSTCQWRPTWAPVLKKLEHSLPKSAPTSSIQTLYVYRTSINTVRLLVCNVTTSIHWYKTHENKPSPPTSLSQPLKVKVREEYLMEIGRRTSEDCLCHLSTFFESSFDA